MTLYGHHVSEAVDFDSNRHKGTFLFIFSTDIIYTSGGTNTVFFTSVHAPVNYFWFTICFAL